MPEGLLELFRGTASPASAGVGAILRGTPTTVAESRPAPAPSPYLRQLLAYGLRASESAPSGLAELDSPLGGGFRPGLHLVAGRTGVGKTALLESVAWEAFSVKRPVLYYSFKDGSQAVWMRLVSELGTILGGFEVPLGALRTRDLSSFELATVRSLDQELQVSVLPWLSLIDDIPASADMWMAFLEDLERGAQRMRDRHGKTPLVLMDDLDRLLLLTGPRPLLALLSHLDRSLEAASVPGLLAMTRSGNSLNGLAAFPVQTALILVPALPDADRRGVDRRAADGLRRVDLRVENTRRRGAATIPLVLDTQTGLFASR